MNPVHPTPESQARAKTIYGYDCAMCHGVNGDGKGDLNRKVPDLRDPASLKGLTDGDIYNIIEVGRADMPDMPPEDGRAKPDEIWNLVIYFGLFRNHRIQQRTLSIPFVDSDFSGGWRPALRFDLAGRSGWTSPSALGTLEFCLFSAAGE